MTKHVLVAVDISHRDEDKNVLLRAQKLAEDEGALLNVMIVLPDFGMSIVGDFFDENAQEKAREKATERLHEYTERHLGKDAKVRHILSTGNVYEEILGMAKKLDAEIIVIGAHRPRFRDYLLGPNAARVVRFAKTSVFVVRQD